MRNYAALLIGTSAIAFAVPAYAQSTQEDVAQAANPPVTAPAMPIVGQGEIVVTASPVICAMVLSVGLPEGFTPLLLRSGGGDSS